MRGAWLAAMLMAGLLVGLWPLSAEADPEVGLYLSITASRAHYAAGEPVALTFTVTNRGEVACRLAGLTDGTVHVTAVTRDGGQIEPDIARTNYVNGMAGEIRAGLRQVAPGQSVSFGLTSVRAASTVLSVTEPMPGGGGLAALWPVDAAGRYTVAATYQMPRVADGTCAGTTNVATASFTVEGSQGGWPNPTLLIAVGAGVGVLILLAAGWLVLRRRHRVPGAAAVLVLAAGLAVVVQARPAHAAFNVPTDVDDDSRQAVFDCTPTFVDPKTGQDVGGFMKTVTDLNTRVVIVVPTVSGETKTIGRNGTGKVIILWNRYDTGDLEPGVPAIPCASLYHELFHASEWLTDEGSKERCFPTGTLVDEVQATFAENKYRALIGKPLRTQYDGKGLPQSLDDCSGDLHPPPDAPTCRGLNGGCGESNGDPHLVTLDQRRYDFQAVGEFVAVRAGGDLEVQTRQRPVADSRSVSVNTAVAARVGPDRVGFFLDGGGIAVRVNGQRPALSDGDRKLPGGGSLTVRTGAYLGSDGYTLSWPDGSRIAVDPIGVYGIRLLTDIAAARRGRTVGLLGNFDGNPANDLVTRDGKALPEQPSHEQLYRTFADSWRVIPAESLFDYASGESTATFTDTSFPDRPLTLADLSASARDRAKAACELAGISTPAVLDDCILDVAATGQPAFAVNASATQALRPASRVVTAGGTVHDGDQAAGSITRTGQVDRFDVDVTSATVARLVDVQAADGVRVSMVGPSGDDQPGFTVTGDYQYRIQPAGTYHVEVTGTGNATGEYRFRLVLAKEHRSEARIGDRINGNLETPGRVDLYRFTPDRAEDIYLTDSAPCAGIAVAIVGDQPAPHVYSPASLCTEITLATVEPNKPYVIVIWSSTWQTSTYTFRIAERHT